MQIPIKSYPTHQWLTLLLWLYGGLGALFVAVPSRFAISSFSMITALLITTVGLYFWSKRCYQRSLQTFEKNLIELMQQDSAQKIQALQNDHQLAVLRICANQVEIERKPIEQSMAALAQHFDILSARLGGHNQEKNRLHKFLSKHILRL